MHKNVQEFGIFHVSNFNLFGSSCLKDSIKAYLKLQLTKCVIMTILNKLVTLVMNSKKQR